MIGKIAIRLTLAGLFVASAVTGALAISSDYAQDVQTSSDPSPRKTTGSSVNQYGKDQVDSQIDNYVYQDDQVNLDRFSGTVKVLRTNQKSLINKYVTALVPLKNASPRELRGIARTICRKEGGDADVLYDKVSKQNYLVVVCPDFQIPYIMKTFAAIDEKWIAEVNDGSWAYYYKGQNRDVHDMWNILKFYRTPDAAYGFDDANNSILFYDQPCIEKLVKWGTEQVDLPPSQVSLDVAIYEVNGQDDLALGFDFESWKNGPGRDLFELAAWNFNGDNPNAYFPGSAPGRSADWGSLHAYNVHLTSAYIDFLQVKGKARLITRSTIATKSGTAGDLAAVDQVAVIQSSTNTAPTLQSFSVGEIMEYYHGTGAFATSPADLTKMPAEEAIATTSAFLKDVVKADAADIGQVTKELREKAADGNISAKELNSVYPGMTIALQVFHDRTLSYTQAGQVGVLLSILPVVGQKSAELALSLNVSDVNGYTPAGAPIIEHRYISSDVEVENGQPFVLGGMKKSSTVRSANGIPFLRDIPIVGYLFGREVTTKSEKDLVVIITPRFLSCPSKEAAAPPDLQTAVKMAKGEEAVTVPTNPFGFDQWLLDSGQ